jgi:SAM-dependent methyltransferase
VSAARVAARRGGARQPGAPAAGARLRRRLLAAGVAAPLAAPAWWARADDKPFSPFITSPEVTVLRMLELARVNAGDLVVDLGSGDGRIPITAALKFGARGYGVDLDAALVELSNRNARAAGVSGRVRFERRDVFATDVREATVVTLYLLPPIVQALRPGLLRQLAPGSRIVSHDFPFEGWKADAVETFFAPEKNNGRGGDSTIFLYIVPADVQGRWQLALPAAAGAAAHQLWLEQQFQEVDGELLVAARAARLADRRLVADRLSFSVVLPERPAAGPVRFEARVSGEVMEGHALPSAGGDSFRWQARRVSRWR